MPELMVGYARCRDDDRIEQRDRLGVLGVSRQRIYLDNSLTACLVRDRVWIRHWQRSGQGALVVTSLARLARSVADARWLGATLADCSIALSLAGTVHDPIDPIGGMFFATLEIVVDCETELRTMQAIQAWLRPGVGCAGTSPGLPKALRTAPFLRTRTPALWAAAVIIG
jgi:hypothetical protein